MTNLDWKEELKIREEKKLLESQKRAEVERKEREAIKGFWVQLHEEISKLDPIIRPKVTDKLIYTLNRSDGIVLILQGLYIERSNSFHFSGIFNPNIIYYYSIQSIGEIGLCITNEDRGHCIKEGDAEIILRNHLMGYPTLKDLEEDIVKVDREWVTTGELKRDKQEKADRVNKIFGTNYKV